MNKVKVRFDKSDGSGSIKLMGYAYTYPTIGKYFGIEIIMDRKKIIIDFGKIYNIKPLDNFLLVQTSMTVVEVEVIEFNDNSRNFDNILMFRPKTTDKFLNEGMKDLSKAVKRKTTKKVFPGLKLIKKE